MARISGAQATVSVRRSSSPTARRPRPWLHIPAVAYLVLLTQVPFLYAIWLSLHSWNLLEPYLGKPFVGLHNFAFELFSDPTFWPALGHTAELVVGALAAALIAGTLLALLLDRPIPGRGILRLVALIPFLVTPSVNALIWKNLILSPSFGVVDWFLGTVLHLPPVAWLANLPLFSVVMMTAWQWTPFFMLVVLAGLQTVSDEIVEAGKVDGARPTQMFFRVVLPQLGKYYEVAILLGTIFIFQTFGKIFIATSGGPGIATTTLPYYTYQVAFQDWEVGQAAALGIFGVALAIVVARLMVQLFASQGEGETADALP